jgi:hypothetical protein
VISSGGGLGRKGIHRLGQSRPGDGLHGKRRDAPSGQHTHQVGCGKWVEKPGEGAFLGKYGGLVDLRRPDHRDQIGPRIRVGDDLGPDIAVRIVGEAGTRTGARLHHHRVALFDQPQRHLGCHRNTALT